MFDSVISILVFLNLMGELKYLIAQDIRWVCQSLFLPLWIWADLKFPLSTGMYKYVSSKSGPQRASLFHSSSSYNAPVIM